MDDMLNVCRTISKLQLMDEGLEEDVDHAGINSRDLSVIPAGGYFGFRSETTYHVLLSGTSLTC
jgi:hypothetical protein